MRVIISTPYLGGVGGLERNVWSTIRALENHEVHIVARRVIASGFVPVGDHFRVLETPISGLPKPWRIWRHVVPSLHRYVRPRLGEFDLYLHYNHAPQLTHLISAKVSAIIPTGWTVAHLEKDFDIALGQAADNVRFLRDTSKHLVVPPPLVNTAPASAPIPGIPDAFLLTVLNPHGPAKGTELLAELADSLALPLVWCHSNETLDNDRHLFSHPNIVHVSSPTQAQLRYLYESCAAYVSFSKTEGFGWAIADALRFNVPTITRRIGVVCSMADDCGIMLYECKEELRTLLERTNFLKPCFDVSWLSAERFAASLEQLVEKGHKL